MNTKSFFLKLLSAQSITPNDDGLLDFIQTYMHEFKAKRLDINGVKNLFLCKKFNDTSKHLCFAGHIDVVPAGDGWLSDPFTPIEKDGFIYARGSQDMKSGICAFIQACKNIQNFDGTLSIILTSDEEGDAKHGTIEVLNYLQNINNLPNAAIIAEPTCENYFGDTVKIGRRGSINGSIIIKGLQGHAAYPKKTKNPIHKIAPILNDLAGHLLDEGDDFFEPSQIVITDIRSGYEVTNLTPDSLKLMFNVRNSTKTTKKDVQNYISNLLKNIDFTLQISQTAKPFITNKNTKLAKNIKDSIYAITKKYPNFSTSGGTSDARFFGEFGIETVEFGVLNDTIHAANEKCYFEDVLMLENVFSNLIKKF